MASISSTGIGSGLDVSSIVSQLVALEKQPLTALAVKATKVTAQVSALGQIQSQFAALTDVASKISTPGAWGARTTASSNTSAATITATATANATNFTLDVDQLAKQQSLSSARLTAGTAVGQGSLTLELGSWTGTAASTAADAAAAAAAAALALDPANQTLIDANVAATSAAAAARPSFSAASGGAPITIDVTATDTVATLAAKINSANAGVVATSFNDGTGDRLLLSSKDTGVAAGFRLKTTDTGDGNNTDNLGLSRLAYDPGAGAFGMASVGIPVQNAQDAKARLNGLAITSGSNTLASNIPGVTIKLAATTTTSVVMSISEDVTPGVKNVNDFVTAYNALSKSLAELTKYDAATNKAGIFQGDASVVALQSVLRNVVGSSSLGLSSQRLADVGIVRKLDGSLSIDTAKLSTAANNGTTLQQLFTNDNNDALTNGFALKFRDLGRGMAASGGALVTKSTALQSLLDINAKAQTKVNDRATLFEARLRKQYTALDTQMTQLNSLNTFITQQVATWNKSSS